MLPNLIIIGAMKAGTSSLHLYLSQHPEISMSNPKELNFFLGGSQWQKGATWYGSHFMGRAKVRGESSPNYTKRHIFAGVPERILALVPKAKLIYVFREPVARCVSHYVHAHYRGRVKAAFSEVFSDLSNASARSIIGTSRYYMQLEPYLRLFSRSQILTIAQEDLLLRRRETLRNVFRFLDVDEEFDSPLFDRMAHQSSSKKELTRLGRAVSRYPFADALQGLPGRIRRIAERFTLAPIPRPVVSPELPTRLKAEFRDDWQRFLDYHNGQVVANAA